MAASSGFSTVLGASLVLLLSRQVLAGRFGTSDGSAHHNFYLPKSRPVGSWESGDSTGSGSRWGSWGNTGSGSESESESESESGWGSLGSTGTGSGWGSGTVSGSGSPTKLRVYDPVKRYTDVDPSSGSNGFDSFIKILPYEKTAYLGTSPSVEDPHAKLLHFEGKTELEGECQVLLGFSICSALDLDETTEVLKYKFNSFHASLGMEVKEVQPLDVGTQEDPRGFFAKFGHCYCKSELAVLVAKKVTTVEEAKACKYQLPDIIKKIVVVGGPFKCIDHSAKPGFEGPGCPFPPEKPAALPEVAPVEKDPYKVDVVVPPPPKVAPVEKTVVAVAETPPAPGAPVEEAAVAVKTDGKSTSVTASSKAVSTGGRASASASASTRGVAPTGDAAAKVAGAGSPPVSPSPVLVADAPKTIPPGPAGSDCTVVKNLLLCVSNDDWLEVDLEIKEEEYSKLLGVESVKDIITFTDVTEQKGGCAGELCDCAVVSAAKIEVPSKSREDDEDLIKAVEEVGKKILERELPSVLGGISVGDAVPTCQ